MRTFLLTLALGAVLVPLLAVPAPCAEPIRIGAFFALSGPAAPIGTPTKLVAQMAVDRINQAGGIGGRPIELVVADTESEPTKAVLAFKKFVNVDHVVAVIGPTRTDTGMAVKRQVEQAKVPTIMTVGGDPVILEGRIGTMDFGTAHWVFKAPQRSSVAVSKVLGYLKAKGLTRVALLTAGDGFGQDGRRWLGKLAPDYGLTVVAEEQFKPTDVDVKSQLVNLAGKNPQAIVVWTIGPAGAVISKNHHALGLAMPLIQCHGQPDPNYIAQAGEAAEGDLMPATKLLTWQSLPDADPQKAVMAEFTRLYSQVYKYDRDYPINTHSGYAWDAITILADALRKAGTDPEKLRAAIENTTNLVGISGVFTITPQDHNGLGPDSMVMIQVKGGKFVPAD